MADNYVNLVYLRLMMNDTGQAWTTLKRGLAYAPDDPALLTLRREEFSRQGVVLPFLRRSHPLNIVLGKMRARLRENSVDVAA